MGKLNMCLLEELLWSFSSIFHIPNHLYCGGASETPLTTPQSAHQSILQLSVTFYRHHNCFKTYRVRDDAFSLSLPKSPLCEARRRHHHTDYISIYLPGCVLDSFYFLFGHSSVYGRRRVAPARVENRLMWR